MEEDEDNRQKRGYGVNRSKPSGKDDEGLRKLLTDQLKDLYWAEKALTKAIPKMIQKATSEELIAALEDHLHVTEQQAQKLEEAFELLGEKASAKKCKAMEGLIKEADDIISELEEGSVRDAGIICAAQKVEHYEIASYGCLSTYAEILDELDVAEIMEEILQEEKEADRTLSQIARAINWEAAEEDTEEEDENEADDETEEDEMEDDTEFEKTGNDPTASRVKTKTTNT